MCKAVRSCCIDSELWTECRASGRLSKCSITDLQAQDPKVALKLTLRMLKVWRPLWESKHTPKSTSPNVPTALFIMQNLNNQPATVAHSFNAALSIWKWSNYLKVTRTWHLKPKPLVWCLCWDAPVSNKSINFRKPMLTTGTQEYKEMLVVANFERLAGTWGFIICLSIYL